MLDLRADTTDQFRPEDHETSPTSLVREIMWRSALRDRFAVHTHLVYCGWLEGTETNTDSRKMLDTTASTDPIRITWHAAAIEFVERCAVALLGCSALKRQPRHVLQDAVFEATHLQH